MQVLHIQPLFGGQRPEAGVWMPYGNDSIVFSTLRFYISGVKLTYTDGSVAAPLVSQQLMDMEEPASFFMQLQGVKRGVPAGLNLALGLDSTANASGIYAGGPDPADGMYWAWQSGYIHFKLEVRRAGKETRQYHLGGYRVPFDTWIPLHFSSLPQSDTLTINMELEPFLQYAFANAPARVMSPGPSAKELMHVITTAMYIRP